MLRIVLTPALAALLLAGCAAKPGDNSQHSLTATSRLHVADAADEAGNKQTAAEMYLAAANEAPGDPQIQLQCAEGLARNGKLDDADTVLTRGLKDSPKEMDLMRTLGALQVMEGKPAQAVQTLSAVLVNQPNDLKALVDKAVALDMLRQHDQAQTLYRRALAASPNDAAISNDLALSLLLAGQPAAGAQVLAPFRADTELPDRIKTNLGIMDAASGHPDDARALLGSRIDATDLAVLTSAINRGPAPATGQP